SPHRRNSTTSAPRPSTNARSDPHPARQARTHQGCARTRGRMRPRAPGGVPAQLRCARRAQVCLGGVCLGRTVPLTRVPRAGCRGDTGGMTTTWESPELELLSRTHALILSAGDDPAQGVEIGMAVTGGELYVRAYRG